MRKKLLVTSVILVFICVLHFNFSSSVGDNSQTSNLKSLNVMAIANAEDNTEATGPIKHLLFGGCICKCETLMNCDHSGC